MCDLVLVRLCKTSIIDSTSGFIVQKRARENSVRAREMLSWDRLRKALLGSCSSNVRVECGMSVEGGEPVVKRVCMVEVVVGQTKES